MEPDAVDPAVFFKEINRARVRWLMIGRQALIHYGVPLQTMDYDIWIDPGAANVEKFLHQAAEAGLDAPRKASEVAARPFFSAFGSLLKVDVFKVRSFTNLDGKTVDFKRAYRRKVIASAKGDPLKIPLPSLADLALLKRMRDTPRDREDLEYLARLQRPCPR